MAKKRDFLKKKRKRILIFDFFSEKSVLKFLSQFRQQK